MLITLIRHGSTNLNSQFRYQGWLDHPLSEEGFREIRLLSNRLSGITFDLHLTSDLIRARQTAESLFKTSEIEIRNDLREISFGKWEGMTHNECMHHFGDIYTRWIDDPNKINPPNGESLFNFKKRISNFLNDLVFRMDISEASNVAIVTHGGPIKAIIQLLEQSGKDINLISAPAPGDFTRIKITDHHKHLIQITCSSNSTRNNLSMNSR